MVRVILCLALTVLWLTSGAFAQSLAPEDQRFVDDSFAVAARQGLLGFVAVEKAVLNRVKNAGEDALIDSRDAAANVLPFVSPGLELLDLRDTLEQYRRLTAGPRLDRALLWDLLDNARIEMEIDRRQWTYGESPALIALARARYRQLQGVQEVIWIMLLV